MKTKDIQELYKIKLHSMDTILHQISLMDQVENEQETVMSMLHGLRKQENSSNVYIGCSFFISSVKAVRFFLYTVENHSIIKPVFLQKFKNNKEIDKPDESLGRKATGPVKWQPVA